MFTGIVEARGTIIAIDHGEASARFTVQGPVVLEGTRHGDSIAVSGVCLTVVEQTADTFTADVMAQTLAMSMLDGATVGSAVNLERAARVGDRLGGHIVQGHVDGTGTIVSTVPGDAWRIVRISLPDALAPLVVDKGSITVDGVSLTVSAVSDPDAAEQWFEVSLIPETLTATTLGDRVPGDRVNLETDILARHVERMLAYRHRAGIDLPSSADREPPAADPLVTTATERGNA
jgi:riboflavin synthase